MKNLILIFLLVLCTGGIAHGISPGAKQRIEKFLSKKYAPSIVTIDKITAFEPADLFNTPEGREVVNEMRIHKDSLVREMDSLLNIYTKLTGKNLLKDHELNSFVVNMKRKRGQESFVKYFIGELDHERTFILVDLMDSLPTAEKQALKRYDQKYIQRYNSIYHKIRKVTKPVFTGFCLWTVFSTRTAVFKVTFTVNDKQYSGYMCMNKDEEKWEKDNYIDFDAEPKPVKDGK